MYSENIQKLARLAVRKGVALKEGQPLIINAPLEAAELARALVKEAYDAKASDVQVRWHDEICDHENLIRGSRDVMEKIPAWQALQLNEAANRDAAFITIVGEDPDLMKDVDPKLMMCRTRHSNEVCKDYRKKIDSCQMAWSIIAAPTRNWAKKVYPELDEEQAVDALWNDIFDISRIDEQDPLENWQKHSDSFLKKMEVLNSLDLAELHYQNALGTDLSLGLPEGYQFLGGASQLTDGTSTLPNIPTEEVFSAPDYRSVNGRVYSTLPLIHNGSKIDGFWLEFQDGKVTDFDAKEGRDVLQSILDTDEGAKSLGEVALVPKDSPIARKHRIFYTTLIDENASCHFALGRSYTDTIKGGLEMSEEQLLAHGMNQSAAHVDFMVGSDDLRITGKTRSGEEVEIFVNGKYSTLFD